MMIKLFKIDLKKVEDGTNYGKNTMKIQIHLIPITASMIWKNIAALFHVTDMLYLEEPSPIGAKLMNMNQ